MLRSTLIILTLAIAFFGCKKDYHCNEKKTGSGSFIYFKNFSTAEVDTIILNYYGHDNTFSNKLQTDTIVSPNAFDSSGIQYHSKWPLYFCYISYNVEIIVPATGNSFRYHASYGTDTLVQYTQSTPCKDHGFHMPADSISVNGTPVPVGHDLSDNTQVILSK